MRLFHPEQQRVTVGVRDPRFLHRRLTIPLSEAKAHTHIMGKSKSGKSYWLAHWYLELIRSGQAATLIDPHGETARLVFAHLVQRGFFTNPENRKRVLYLDLPAAAERGLYLPFNLFATDQPPTTIAADIKDAMHRAFPELAQGAAVFDTLLPRSVRVLLHHKLTFSHLETFLTDKRFRNTLLDTFPDADVVRFFREVLDKLRASDQLAYMGSVLRRAQLLTDLPILRASFGQQENLLQYKQLMDSGTSVIINLFVRPLEAMKLLGCLMTVAAENGAMTRSKPNRTHWLFLDEFANFTAQSEQSLDTILSQTRKMGLYAVLAHQTWSQASSHLRGALGNVELEIAYKLGRDDAEYSARIFGEVDPLSIKHEVKDEHVVDRTHPTFYTLQEQWENWVRRLNRLKRQQAYVRLPSDAVHHIHSVHLPKPVVHPGELAELEEYYLSTYFKPATQNEEPAILAAPPLRKPHRIASLEE